MVFLTPRVEPTNNRAERTPRGACRAAEDNRDAQKQEGDMNI